MMVVVQLEFLNLIQKWSKTTVLILRSVAIQSGQIIVEVPNPLPFPAILQAEEAIECFYSGTQVDVVNLDLVETGSGVIMSFLSALRKLIHTFIAQY